MQSYRSLLVGATLMFAAVGCHTPAKQSSAPPVIAPGPAPMRLNARVYVALPEDGIDKKNPVPGSGKRTEIVLEDAFKKHTRNVVAARMPETLDEAISHARDLQYDFVAMATILKWEDRPTEWTGVRDKLQVKIDLVSVETGQILRTTTIDTKGKWMGDEDQHPQDLLPDPVDKFVRTLFRMTYTPSALDR